MNVESINPADVTVHGFFGLVTAAFHSPQAAAAIKDFLDLIATVLKTKYPFLSAGIDLAVKLVESFAATADPNHAV